MKEQLLSMTPEELGAYLKELGQPAFRARQVFSWLHQGVPFDGMSNLPKTLRETLKGKCHDNPVQVIETIKSKLDGTIKLLYKLHDEHIIEGVLMRYKYGNTLCLSTQVGCRMGCKFCASTLDGCARSLTPGEMLGQIIAANGVLAAQEAGQKVGNIVLMGSGEPFDNYDNVVKFLRILRMEGKPAGDAVAFAACAQRRNPPEDHAGCQGVQDGRGARRLPLLHRKDGPPRDL